MDHPDHGTARLRDDAAARPWRVGPPRDRAAALAAVIRAAIAVPGSGGTLDGYAEVVARRAAAGAG